MGTYFRSGGALLVAAFPLVGGAWNLLAQPANGNVTVGPMPEWVQPIAFQEKVNYPTNQLYTGLFSRLIEDQVQVERAEHYRHFIYHIVSASGVQTGARLSVVFDPSYQQVVLHQAQIRRGAQVLNRLEPDKIKVLQQEKDLERHLYNGALSVLIFLEDVRVDDRVEYAYTVRGVNPALAGRYVGGFVVQWPTPVEQQYWRLVFSPSRKLALRTHGNITEPVIREADGLRQWEWMARDIPAVPVEHSTPSWHYPYAWVEVSEFGTWAEVGRWAAERYPAPEKLVPELQEKIDHWRQTKTNEESRVLAALDFVQEEVRYLGMEYGLHSFVPSSPNAVYARRFGDCKDKTYLLCAILQAMNIDAQPALVNTRLQHSLSDLLPTPTAFNHVVARVRVDQRHFWVDATRSHQRGPLTQRYFPGYARCLLIGPTNEGLSVMSFPQTGLPRTTVNQVFKFRGWKGPAELEVSTTAEGLDAELLRTSLAWSSREQFEKHIMNDYARLFPKIQRTRPLEVEDRSDSNEVRLRAHYRIEGAWTPLEDQAYYHCFNPTHDIEARLSQPDQSERSLPFAIYHPCHRILRTEAVLPQPWWTTTETKTVTSEAFIYSAKRAYKKGRLTFEYEYRTRTNGIAAAAVPAHVKSIREVREDLDCRLYWPKHTGLTGSKPSRMVAVLAGFYVNVFSLAVLSFCFCRGAPSFSRSPPPPLPGEAHLCGIGGWLVVLGIYLACTSLLVRVETVWLLPRFSPSTWHSLTAPGAASYHPLWAPFLVLALLGNLTNIGLSVCLLALFFTKHHWFPILFIAHLVLMVLCCSLQICGNALVPAETSKRALETASAWTGASLRCFLWIPYVLLSRRVRLTFVN